MTTSDGGIRLIKNFEGLRLEAYQDSVGVWTIGYGHTGSDVYYGLKITEFQAEELMRRDLSRFEVGVFSALTRRPTQMQFDAMVSLAYNVGITAFKTSTLLQKFNASEEGMAARQFAEFIFAGGAMSRGLIRRRAAEIVHFLGGLA